MAWCGVGCQTPSRCLQQRARAAEPFPRAGGGGGRSAGTSPRSLPPVWPKLYHWEKRKLGFFSPLSLKILRNSPRRMSKSCRLCPLAAMDPLNHPLHWELWEGDADITGGAQGDEVVGPRPSQCPKSSSLTPPPHPGDRKDQEELQEPPLWQSVSPQSSPRHLRAAPRRLKGKEKREGGQGSGQRVWPPARGDVAPLGQPEDPAKSPLAGKRRGRYELKRQGWDALPQCLLRGVCLW